MTNLLGYFSLTLHVLRKTREAAVRDNWISSKHLWTAAQYAELARKVSMSTVDGFYTDQRFILSEDYILIWEWLDDFVQRVEPARRFRNKEFIFAWRKKRRQPLEMFPLPTLFPSGSSPGYYRLFLPCVQVQRTSTTDISSHEIFTIEIEDPSGKFDASGFVDLEGIRGDPIYFEDCAYLFLLVRILLLTYMQSLSVEAT